MIYPAYRLGREYLELGLYMSRGGNEYLALASRRNENKYFTLMVIRSDSHTLQVQQKKYNKIEDCKET